MSGLKVWNVGPYNKQSPDDVQHAYSPQMKEDSLVHEVLSQPWSQLLV
jgi:hypothetical protein